MKHNIVTLRNMSKGRIYLGGIEVNPVIGYPIDAGCEYTYCQTCFDKKIYASTDKDNAQANIRMLEMLTEADVCPLLQPSDNKLLNYETT